VNHAASGSSGSPLPPVSRASLRAALEAGGAVPRKRHGQHFLLDDNLLAAIVRDAGVGLADQVLEVGPGPGLLTRHLLAAGCRVVALEIDPAMTGVARALIEPALRGAGRLRWIEADALAGGRRLGPELLAALPECSALVANLPYGIAGALLGSLAGHPAAPGRSVVMVQRELAERLMAPPGTRDFGPLAVLVALTSQVRLLRRVPARAFWPAPRVESAVVSLTTLPDGPPAAALDALRAFLGGAFHARRKTMVNSLAEWSGTSAHDVLACLSLQENQQKWRAEAFEAVQLFELAQVWAVHALGERHRPSDRSPNRSGA